MFTLLAPSFEGSEAEGLRDLRRKASQPASSLACSDHGHPFDGRDIIVCWRHNWPDCPPQIEILELSSLIKSLPTSDD